MFRVSNCSDIWQASGQDCCWGACQISKGHEHFSTQSRGFETLRRLVRNQNFPRRTRILGDYVWHRIHCCDISFSVPEYQCDSTSNEVTATAPGEGNMMYTNDWDFIPLRAEFYFGNTNIGVPYIIPRRRDGAGNQDPIIWKRTAYLSYIVRVMAAADLTTQGVMESAAWDWPSFQHYSGCAIKRIFNNALTGSI